MNTIDNFKHGGGTTARGQRYNCLVMYWDVQPRGINPGVVVGPIPNASGTTARASGTTAEISQQQLKRRGTLSLKQETEGKGG